MTDEVKKEVKKIRSDKELRLIPSTETDSLSGEELDRYLKLIEIDARVQNVELVRHQTDQFKMKAQERKDRFRSRGYELEKTKRDQAIHQSNCSHRKGGRGLEGLQRGGNAADYAVIRHLLPWNEWYQRCQRCGKTWKPVHKVDFDMDTPEGQKAYTEAQLEYKTALSWPTDNIPSTGITFKHESADGNKTAEAFIHDLTKDITLR
jgi:hypothetical protein